MLIATVAMCMMGQQVPCAWIKCVRQYGGLKLASAIFVQPQCYEFRDDLWYRAVFTGSLVYEFLFVWVPDKHLQKLIEGWLSLNLIWIILSLCKRRLVWGRRRESCGKIFRGIYVSVNKRTNATYFSLFVSWKKVPSWFSQISSLNFSWHTKCN